MKAPDLGGFKPRHEHFFFPQKLNEMRASQNIPSSSSYRMTPAQRRLSAALTGPGMRKDARRSAMPPARKAELAIAITGGLLILSLIAGLMAI
jgi:hypothetical protein